MLQLIEGGSQSTGFQTLQQRRSAQIVHYLAGSGRGSGHMGGIYRRRIAEFANAQYAGDEEQVERRGEAEADQLLHFALVMCAGAVEEATGFGRFSTATAAAAASAVGTFICC